MGQRRPRVLIVEDDSVFRRGPAHIFHANETEVIQASDGNRAQALIGDEPFDLVICDYRLPGVDGLSLLTRLKVAQPGTPFVLVTAHCSEEVLKESRARGGDAVLEKPIELGRLIDECERLLGCPLPRGRTSAPSQDENAGT